MMCARAIHGIAAVRRAGPAALALLMAAGCVTTQQSAAPRPPPLERADLAVLEERVRRNQGDVESIQMQIDRLREDLERIQANTATSFHAQITALEGNLESLRQRLTEMESQRVRDREEVISKLSARMTELLNQQTAGRSQTRSRTSEYGYEHVVAAGESLSKIASEYGVSMGAIIDANKLTNPDTLRVGQKLFIPD
jgi:LysM repeat protein